MPMLPIDMIKTNGRTQPRASLSDTATAKYANDMLRGAKLPPVDVFHDGGEYILAHGFHRLRAVMLLVQEEGWPAEIEANIHEGTLRDAILFSVGCNAENGMIRDIDDERRAVRLLLDDPEWGQWSDNKIAAQCRVSHDFVRALRNEMFPEPAAEGERKYRIYSHPKSGKPVRMDVTDIGRKKQEPGAREHDVADRALAVEGVMQAIRTAMKALPSEPEVLVANAGNLDVEELERWADYWTAAEVSARMRVERVS